MPRIDNTNYANIGWCFVCAFLSRFKTLRRRANFQLVKLRSRLHIAEGLLVALQRIGDLKSSLLPQLLIRRLIYFEFLNSRPSRNLSSAFTDDVILLVKSSRDQAAARIALTSPSYGLSLDQVQSSIICPP